MFNFIKKLFFEIAENGKLLLGYLLQEIPGLTDYPGLKTAIEDVLANPTRENFIKFLIQALMAGAAGHRAIKIVTKILKIG